MADSLDFGAVTSGKVFPSPLSLRTSPQTGAPQGGLSCPSGNSPPGNPFSKSRFTCFYKSWIRRNAPPRIPLRVKERGTKEYAGMVELVDSVDLGSTARACRFESCCPHQTNIIRTKFSLWEMGSDLLFSSAPAGKERLMLLLSCFVLRQNKNSSRCDGQHTPCVFCRKPAVKALLLLYFLLVCDKMEAVHFRRPVFL